MPKPSIVRAFNSTVLPNLTAIGFQQLGGKQYVRVRDDICQFLFLHVESRIRREFMLEYSAMLIVQPHDFVCLDSSGRLPDRNGGWYPAHNDQRLTESVGLVADQVRQTLVPWYEGCITVQGFVDTYHEYAEGNGHFGRNGHAHFTLACAHAKNNEATVAMTHARQAIEDYETIYTDRPACTWAKIGAERSRQLLDALADSSHDKLFAQWRSHTIEALKLAPVVDVNDDGG